MSTTDVQLQATLPSKFLEPTLSSLKVGQTGFTVPWALRVDGDRLLWLKPSYWISSHPHGTASMEVQRLEDGYHVRLPKNHRWSIQEGFEPDQIPVTGLLNP